MIADVLRAVFGILALMLLWFGVQAVIRRGQKASPNADVLDHVKHGCGGCPQESCCDTVSSDPAALCNKPIPIRR